MVCLSNRRLIVPSFVSFVSYKNPSLFSMLHIVSVAISTPDSSRSDLSSLGVLGSGFPPFKPTFEVFSSLFSSSSVSRGGSRQLQVSYKLLKIQIPRFLKMTLYRLEIRRSLIAPLCLPLQKGTEKRFLELFKSSPANLSHVDKYHLSLLSQK